MCKVSDQLKLLKMLNSGNCFDIELHHQEEDILELHFTINSDT